MVHCYWSSYQEISQALNRLPAPQLPFFSWASSGHRYNRDITNQQAQVKVLRNARNRDVKSFMNTINTNQFEMCVFKMSKWQLMEDHNICNTYLSFRIHGDPS